MRCSLNVAGYFTTKNRVSFKFLVSKSLQWEGGTKAPHSTEAFAFTQTKLCQGEK
jgi:hypothetical protein